MCGNHPFVWWNHQPILSINFDYDSVSFLLCQQAATPDSLGHLQGDDAKWRWTVLPQFPPPFLRLLKWLKHDPNDPNPNNKKNNYIWSPGKWQGNPMLSYCENFWLRAPLHRGHAPRCRCGQD